VTGSGAKPAWAGPAYARVGFRMTETPAVTISPDRFDAVIFDLDGVVTDTARVHLAAWRRLFDGYLAARDPSSAPFTDDDYLRYVDGRARIDGVEAFLESRGIRLDRGVSTDPPAAQTSWGMANRKNGYYLAALGVEGVDVFASSVRVVEAVRAAGLGTAVVTASKNRAEVLEIAGLSDLFDVHVDGVDAEALGLPGKPDPATFLEAASRLGVTAARSVVVEDAIAGVEAGRNGGFGLVIGIDRRLQAHELREHGADAVVQDLALVEITPHGERGGRE